MIIWFNWLKNLPLFKLKILYSAKICKGPWILSTQEPKRRHDDKDFPEITCWLVAELILGLSYSNTNLVC